MLSRITLIIISILFLVIIKSCATKGFPMGGPEDRTPPEVIKIFPKADSINVNPSLNKIVIEFSERMNEGTLPNSIFISPPLKYKIKWSAGKEVKLNLQDSLKTDQTYVISIGTNAEDERRNKMKESFQFAFSTGSRIDHGSISGIVYDIKKNETVNLFAYLLNDSLPPDPAKTEPFYVSQSGSGGAYKLGYLKQGLYRMFAAQDQNNNLLIDADYERVGLPYRDVLLDSINIHFSGLDFRMTKNDTISPFMVGARSLNNSYIQIRLSEPVVMSERTQFTIVDSLCGSALDLLGISQNIESDNIIDVFTEKMDTSAYYQIHTTSLEDSSGNIDTSGTVVSFKALLKEDTTKFELVAMLPEDSASAVRPESEIFLEFSNPAEWKSVEDNFILYSEGGDTINGNWEINSVFDAEFYPHEPLKPDSSYHVSLNLGCVKNLWGKAFNKDSICSRYFTIVESRELGEMSGMVQVKDSIAKPVYLNIKYLNKRTPPFKIMLEQPGEFYINCLPDGEYLIDGFVDLDENAKFSFGRLYPFEFAEPFYFLKDTIKVRKRWEKEGVNLILPGGAKK